MGKRRRVVLAVFGLPAALLLLAGGFLIGGAQAGFTAALASSSNAVGTGTAFLSAQQGSTDLCSSQPAGTSIPATSTFACSGSILPDNVTVGSSKVTTLTNNGSQPFGTSAVKVNSCSAQVLTNTKVANNGFVARGDLGWANAGVSKLAGSGSIGFNGTNTLGSQFTASAGLQTYSIAAWFKTSTSQGAVFSWATNLIGGSYSTFDRALFFDGSGNLSFYTYPGVAQKVTTSGTNYADGSWHLAVATAAAGTAGVSGGTTALYVDNAYIGSATNPSTTSTNSSEANTGYWRVGHAFASNAGGNGNYFNGNISNMAVFPTALSASGVSSLWGQSTQSGYAGAASTLGATSFWPLNDPGTATAANSTTIALGTYDPCLHVNITVASSTECVYPAGASCPAIGSSSSIGAMIASGSKAFTSPTGGGSTTLTITTAKNASWINGNDENIDLLLDESVITTKFPQTFRWTK